jgi:release factor glutamine methyltransferase
VTGFDLSEEALALAAENAMATGLGVRLVQGDLRAGLPAGRFDLVVSNPPYVDLRDEPALAPEVREWEPRLALFGTGLAAELAERALPVLVPGGALVIEVGDGQADEAAGTARSG